MAAAREGAPGRVGRQRPDLAREPVGRPERPRRGPAVVDAGQLAAVGGPQRPVRGDGERRRRGGEARGDRADAAVLDAGQPAGGRDPHRALGDGEVGEGVAREPLRPPDGPDAPAFDDEDAVVEGRGPDAGPVDHQAVRVALEGRPADGPEPAALEDGHAVRGRRPDPPAPVDLEVADIVAGEAVLGRVGHKVDPIEP